MWDIKGKIEQRKWGKYLKNAITKEQKEEKIYGEQEKQEIMKLTKKQNVNWK